jgi:hypothetical protein
MSVAIQDRNLKARSVCSLLDVAMRVTLIFSVLRE